MEEMLLQLMEKIILKTLRKLSKILIMQVFQVFQEDIIVWIEIIDGIEQN